MDYIEIRLIRRLPKEVRRLSLKKNLIVTPDEIVSLDERLVEIYDSKRYDTHRAKFAVRERYCSMEDIMRHVRESYPEKAKAYDGASWAMSCGSSDAYRIEVYTAEGYADHYSIPKSETEKLATDHISEKYFEIVDSTYTLDVGYAYSWLKEINPTYLTKEAIANILSYRVSVSKEKSDDELSDDVKNAYERCSDVFGFMCDCMKLAQRKGCKAWMCPIF